MPDNVLWRLNGYDTRMPLNKARVKYGLDYFLDYFFWTIFFGPFHKGGKHIISTQGNVGCSLLVPREG